jgi:hypothetical protein
LVWRRLGYFIPLFLQYVENVISLESEINFECVNYVPEELEGGRSGLTEHFEESFVVFKKRDNFFPLCSFDDYSLFHKFLK